MAGAGPSVRRFAPAETKPRPSAAPLMRTVSQMARRAKRVDEFRGQMLLRDRGRADVGGFTTNIRVVVAFANFAARRFALSDLGDLNADRLRITR